MTKSDKAFKARKAAGSKKKLVYIKPVSTTCWRCGRKLKEPLPETCPGCGAFGPFPF